MKTVRNILLAVAVAAGLLVTGIWAFRTHREEIAGAQESEAPLKAPSRVSRGPRGETVVKLDRETQQHIGLAIAGVSGTSHRPELTAYGHIEEDPSQSFVVRASTAGTLVASGRAWPGTGQILPPNSTVGSIAPRLAPAERITLEDRLATAKAEAAAAEASTRAAAASLERLRALNAAEKNVSDRAVQEAEAKLKGEEARAEAGRQSVQLLETALTRRAAPEFPLAVPGGGQVVEVMAQPGESVEPGQAILRVSRFHRLLARIDIPAGDSVPASVTSARIIAIGYETRPLRAERVAVAAAVDPKVQGQPILFRLADAGLPLRPGLAVTAYVELPGATRAGAVAPDAAVVRYSGKTWVYVQTAPDQFARREVTLEGRAPGGWFTSSLAAGDKVVTAGAQTLLSEEFKSQISVGEENQS